MVLLPQNVVLPEVDLLKEVQAGAQQDDKQSMFLVYTCSRICRFFYWMISTSAVVSPPPVPGYGNTLINLTL